MNVHSNIDITPTPRILRTLGEIPFLPWQCMAELIDNSIDAFQSNHVYDEPLQSGRITINWDGENVAPADRTVEISDNASGMSLEQIQNAVRAGYSSNDTHSHLGLFGMGFNISTARLGEVTTILSTRQDDNEWVGVRINFEELIKSGTFDAPIVRFPKERENESGTRITVSKLRAGMMQDIISKESEIRRRLESVYSPLLSTKDITIFVRGKQLRPKRHCVWDKKRYVRYGGKNVYAYKTIDFDFGEALFDENRNCYLSPAEADEFRLFTQEQLPKHIIQRSMRLTGWIGIQRYASPNDYGIDFIRNGRKILVSDKSLFQYENPYSGQSELQYPVELGSTVGGRIVGEINVDYLLPTYQKNDFDRSDASWKKTVEALRGTGPFLQRARKAMGFSEQNESPIGELASAYRRVDKGTKCLFVPNAVAEKMAREFHKGTADFIDDSKWWRAAQEEDQKQGITKEKTTPVNFGEEPSDDVLKYLPGSTDTGTPTGVAANAGKSWSQQVAPSKPTSPQSSSFEDLHLRSTESAQLSGSYEGAGTYGTFNVQVRELSRGNILVEGKSVPCVFKSDGMECEFIYNPKHQLLAQYTITPKMLLLIYLSEKLKARDSMADVISAFSSLVQTSMPEEKLDIASIQERAKLVFERLRQSIERALQDSAQQVIECIHEAAGEVEETVSLIVDDTKLLREFQNKTAEAYGVINFIPLKTLIRLVNKFPEHLFDDQVFDAPYSIIELADKNATRRMRNAAKERIITYIKDALRIINISTQELSKEELIRASLSIDALLKKIVA